MYNFFKRTIGFFKRLFGMNTDLDFVPMQIPLVIAPLQFNINIPRTDLGLLNVTMPVIAPLELVANTRPAFFETVAFAHATRLAAQVVHPVISLLQPEPTIFNPGEPGQNNGFSFYRAGVSGTTLRRDNLAAPGRP